MSAMVIISDRLEPNAWTNETIASPAPETPKRGLAKPDVRGGYLERLPLAAIRHGIVDFAEIWHHRIDEAETYTKENAHLVRRTFKVDGDMSPFHSEAILRFIHQHGAPRILCVWGLGVSEEILEACRESFIIYNSIDAPAIRVPREVSRHFDLVLTGAQWQADEIEDRHSGMASAIMPIGPEFASPETFFPTGDTKIYDVIYVAAAQPYKRHDLLFAALVRAPRRLKALCVIGYGEDADVLQRQAVELGLDVDFIGPPGVSHSEVNRLMNLARVGVVCGVDDGAPAILTEYMLAGLPVVANSDLKCGLQYILPETGLIVAGDKLEDGILEALAEPNRFSPRQAVIDRWSWPHSIAALARLVASATTQSQIPTFPISSGYPEGGSIEPSSFA